MKVLVIGGMHGNELLGIKLVALLQQSPIKNVDVVIGNPRAVEQNVRFIDTDLNRSFGMPTEANGSYENSLAAKLTTLAKDYDYVFDFHNTQTPNNNCSFVGSESTDGVYNAARALGLTRCIQATYSCINMATPNTLSIEVSIGDQLDDPAYWYEQIHAFMNNTLVAVNDLEVYRFSRRVTWEEKAETAISGWQPFVAISQRESDMLNVFSGSVPIFIGSKLTNYYATILEPINKMYTLAK